MTIEATADEADIEVLPRVKSVAAGPRFTLNVEWKDGSRTKADLTGLIHSSKHFGVFARDAAAFRHVRPVAWGDGVQWDNGLDYSAATLKELAEEQQPMKGSELKTFVIARKLNNEELAGLLGCTARTIRAWYGAKRIPRWAATSVRCLQRDDTLFAAHFRPVKVRPRGRPKTAASD
ncbi:MAG TPA: hypothetical protein VII49_02675 [Rhizomicrobium sp.]